MVTDDIARRALNGGCFIGGLVCALLTRHLASPSRVPVHDCERRPCRSLQRSARLILPAVRLLTAVPISQPTRARTPVSTMAPNPSHAQTTPSARPIMRPRVCADVMVLLSLLNLSASLVCAL